MNKENKSRAREEDAKAADLRKQDAMSETTPAEDAGSKAVSEETGTHKEREPKEESGMRSEPNKGREPQDEG